MAQLAIGHAAALHSHLITETELNPHRARKAVNIDLNRDRDPAKHGEPTAVGAELDIGTLLNQFKNK